MGRRKEETDGEGGGGQPVGGWSQGKSIWSNRKKSMNRQSKATEQLRKQTDPNYGRLNTRLRIKYQENAESKNTGGAQKIPGSCRKEAHRIKWWREILSGQVNFSCKRGTPHAEKKDQKEGPEH